MVFCVERAVAVFFVARHRMPDKRHVRADLVRFAAVQGDLCQRIFPVFFAHFVVGAYALGARRRFAKQGNVRRFFVLF